MFRWSLNPLSCRRSSRAYSAAANGHRLDQQGVACVNREPSRRPAHRSALTKRQEVLLARAAAGKGLVVSAARPVDPRLVSDAGIPDDERSVVLAEQIHQGL